MAVQIPAAGDRMTDRLMAYHIMKRGKDVDILTSFAVIPGPGCLVRRQPQSSNSVL